MKNSNPVLLTAAIAGIMGATIATANVAQADDGKCKGANACKGQSACKTAANECAGHNGCKGTGFTQSTKADCDKMAAKNKKIKFEAPAPAAAVEKKS